MPCGRWTAALCSKPWICLLRNSLDTGQWHQSFQKKRLLNKREIEKSIRIERMLSCYNHFSLSWSGFWLDWPLSQLGQKLIKGCFPFFERISVNKNSESWAFGLCVYIKVAFGVHVQQLSEPESFSGRTSSRWLVNVNPESQEPCPEAQGNYPDASSWYCVISCSTLSANGAWAFKMERKVESRLFFWRGIGTVFESC